MKKNLQLTTYNLQLNRGQAMITAVIFFLSVSTVIVLGAASPILREAAAARELQTSKQSYVLAESLVEDMTYRTKKGIAVSSVESLTVGTDTAYATSTNVSGLVTIVSTGNKSDARRKVQTVLSSGDGESFHYGIQVGVGGIQFNNSSSVTGNVYANGEVSGNGNVVRGDIVSAGPSGRVNTMHATSSVYAHTIENSTVDKNAYYQSISGSAVSGTSFPGSADQATTTLPISDAEITDWETDAAAGGSVICSGGAYNISGTVTLGPKKIPCDLNISGTAVVTLAGPVWATGTINFSNSADVKVDSSLSGKTIPMIADKASDRLTSSQIFVSNTLEFFGAGAGSYIILISMNNSAEGAGGNGAVVVSNSASGKVLVYAPHGTVQLNNSVSLKEVSGYQIELNNSSNVIYETGLANLLFTAGPSGGYIITDWKETQ